MKPEALVREMEALARRAGLGVRVERGRFRGGPCRLDGQRLVVLNRLHAPETNAAVLADALRAADLDGLFVPPAVRKLLDEPRDVARGTQSVAEP